MSILRMLAERHQASETDLAKAVKTLVLKSDPRQLAVILTQGDISPIDSRTLHAGRDFILSGGDISPRYPDGFEFSFGTFARRSAHVSGSKGVRRARANGLTSAAGKEVAE